MERGQVWWADLGTPRGSEPGYQRPVVVVQADPLNRSLLGSVMVVPLTTNLSRADAPGNVLLHRRRYGLPRDSVVHVAQVVSVDRSRLERHLTTLPGAVMSRVDDGLRLTLGL